MSAWWVFLCCIFKVKVRNAAFHDKRTGFGTLIRIESKSEQTIAIGTLKHRNFHYQGTKKELTA